MNNQCITTNRVLIKSLSSNRIEQYDLLTSRNQIKGFFVKKQQNQLSDYVKDLEKTISINKRIIANLLTETKNHELSKDIIGTLNEENSQLQAKLTEIISERDSFQAKLLISEQIIIDYKNKEDEYEKQLKESIKDLKEQLEAKEFVIQSWEHKFYKLLDTLREYTNKDESLAASIKKLNIKIEKKKKISNIIDENNELKEQLSKLTIEMQALKKKAIEHSESERSNKSIQTLYECDSTKTNNKNKDLNNEIDKITKENAMIKDGLIVMQKKNEKIYSELISAKNEVIKLRKANFALSTYNKDASFNPCPLKNDSEIIYGEENMEDESLEINSIIEKIK